MAGRVGLFDDAAEALPADDGWGLDAGVVAEGRQDVQGEIRDATLFPRHGPLEGKKGEGSGEREGRLPSPVSPLPSLPQRPNDLRRGRRLGEIQAAVGIPLVLHGGSGTPEADLRRAIGLGIAKVNVATEFVTAMRESLLGQWQTDRTPQDAARRWLPAVMAEAMKAIPPLLEKWLRATGAAGRA